MPRLVCVLVAAAVLWCEFTVAQDTPVKVTGIVKKLDVKNGTVTIRPNLKGATEDETFNLLKKDIEVTTPSGEKARLDVVIPGQTVHLKLGAAGDVEALTIQAPIFLATVADVDINRRTVAIASEGIPNKTMPVAIDAKVLLAGRSVFLREVKPGSEMNVTTSLDGKTVLGLNLVTDPDGKLATKLYPRVKTSRLPGVRYFGVITDADVSKNEFKLTGPKTKGVPKAMPLAKDAMIQVIYAQVVVQKITLNQLVDRPRGTVMVSAERQQVTRVLAEPPLAHAKVKALDGEAGKLTVAVDGAERVFTLQRDIKVMNRTRVMRLADLQPNAAVTLVLSLDREQLLAVDVSAAE